MACASALRRPSERAGGKPCNEPESRHSGPRLGQRFELRRAVKALRPEQGICGLQNGSPLTLGRATVLIGTFSLDPVMDVI